LKISYFILFLALLASISRPVLAFYEIACQDVFPQNMTANGPQLDVPTFQYNATTTKKYVGWKGSEYFSAGDYALIHMGSSSSLVLGDSGSLNNRFRIARLEVGWNAKLDLSPGDYWIENLTINSKAKISLKGEGTVRLFVKNALSIGWNTKIESKNSYLIIVAESSVATGGNVKIDGLIYSKTRIDLGFNDHIKGAIAAPQINSPQHSNIKINYHPEIIENLDFGSMCSNTSEPPSDPVPVLDMRFDEVSWEGANSVLDSSPHSNHGSPFYGNGNPLTHSVKSPFCRAIDLREEAGDNYLQGVSINSKALNGAKDFTIVVWGKKEPERIGRPANKTPHDVTILSGFKRDKKNDKDNALIYYFAHDYGSQGLSYRFWPSINVKYFDEDSRLEQNLTIADDQWHQFVWTRKANTKQSCFYLDGELQGCITHGKNKKLEIANNGLFLGQEQDSLGGTFDSLQAWDGYLDELLIFHQALSKTEINTLRDNVLGGKTWDDKLRTSCTVGPDHYRIVMPPAGLTCQASEVLVKACKDASCDQLFMEPTSAMLTATNEAVPSSLTFTNGLATATLNKPIFGSTTVDLSGLSPTASATEPVQCVDDTGVVVSCSVSFADTGLVFSPIPTQVAGKPSDVEFNATTLSIQALKKGDNFGATGRCENVYPPNTQVDVGFRYTCKIGELCSNRGPLITGSGESKELTSDSFTDVTLSFGANSVANYVFNYPDTGRLRLSVKDIAPNGAVLRGDSLTSFTIRPFGLRLSVADAVFSNDSNGDAFKQAGQDFVVQVEPIAWLKKGQDNNDDGNYDKGQDVSGNDAIVAFNGGTVNLSKEKQFPQGSNTSDGILSITSAPNFANSSTTLTASWNEVGIIDLTATLAYSSIAWGAPVQGFVENLGRFTPSYFDVDLSHGIVESKCADFSYIGEMNEALTEGIMAYDILAMPHITLTAKNAGGQTTVNYQQGFYKLNVSPSSPSFVVKTPTQDDVKKGTSGAPMKLTAVVNTGTLAATTTEIDGVSTIDWGAFDYTLANEDHFTYEKNGYSRVEPFTAKFSLVFSKLSDADGITIHSSSTLPTLKPVGHQIRFGRAYLVNSFGPEDKALNVPLQYQYWQGNQFTVNPDHCSAYTMSDVTVNPVAPPDPQRGVFGAIDSSTFSNDSLSADRGFGSIGLPVSNKIGETEIEIDVPTWLKYDWQQSINPVYDKNPRAQLIFGRYRGNDRVINWREIR